jgi:predicted phage tail protein
VITVLLYGALRKKFGKFHRFDIRSPAEAIRALVANFPGANGFQQHLIEHSAPGYHVLVGRESRDERTLAHPADDVIRIVPAVAGAKKQGVLQTILGVVLIIVGVFTTIFGDYSGSVIMLGISLVVGGVTQMLAKPPKVPGPAERPDNLPSYGFDGATNTTAQGNPVPICYGQGRIGSQVVSIGLSTAAL